MERASTILQCFSDGESLRVGDVAKLVGIGQSTASRLLATLEEAGLVERDPVSSLYSLGTGLLTLAGVALNQHPVHQAGRAIAQEFARNLGLGVNIAVRRGAHMVYLCNFEGQLSPKSHTLMGQRVPVHATSVGKALLATVPSEQRARAIGRLTPFTRATITEAREFQAEMARTRQRGYAIEVEEYVAGRASVAAPILDQQGRGTAAVSISGPRSGINLEEREAELSRHVIEIADKISSSLGYHGPAASRVSGIIAD